MTQTEVVTNRIYDKHLLTITPLEVVLMAELSDQIPDYPHTHALNEGPNVSSRKNENLGAFIGLRNALLIEFACAVFVWGVYEMHHALASLAHVIFRLF